MNCVVNEGQYRLEKVSPYTQHLPNLLQEGDNNIVTRQVKDYTKASILESRFVV
jgi:hypothetical protein